MSLFQRITAVALFVLMFLSLFFGSLDEIYPFFYSETLLLAITGSLFIVAIIVISRFHFREGLTILDAVYLIFFIWVVIRAVTSRNLFLFIDSFYTEFIYLVLFFLLKEVFSDLICIKKEHVIVSIITVLSILVVVLCVLELTEVIPIFNREFKINGGLGNPGVLANYISICIPFLLVLFWKKNKLGKWNRRIVYALLPLLVVILLFVQARAAWLSAICATLYILGHSKKFQNKIKYFFKGRVRKLITILTTVTLLFVSGVFLYQLKKDSANGRILIWKNSIEAIKEKPFVGHGYHSFIEILNKQQIAYFIENQDDTKNGLLASSAVYAFNDFIQITLELGFIGLIVYGLMLYFVFFNTPSDNLLLIAAKSGLVAYVVSGLFSYPGSIVQIKILFVFCLSIVSLNVPKIAVPEILKFKVRMQRLIGVSVTCIAIFIAAKSVEKLKACRVWEKTYRISMNNAKQAVSDYQGIFPVLRNDPDFIFNYASVNLVTGDYNKCLNLLNISESIYSNYDGYLMLADAYKGNGDFINAEKQYLNASNLIPHKFTPLYKLFQLYRSQGDSKAQEVAERIVQMEVKVYSFEVGNMKNEALNYLSNSK